MNYCKIVLLSFVLLVANKGYSQNMTSVNVVKMGADGTDKADDTTVFQQCIDKLAAKGGGTLVIPKGTYYINHLLFLGAKYSNIEIKGQNAIIIQTTPKNRKVVQNGLVKTFAQRLAADGCFVFDAQVSNQINDQKSIKNITISGLAFKSDILKQGFDELMHLISAHGVSNFKINNCTFTGFLGDGIAINGATDFTVNRNAYNKDISITNCVFDGINKDNRQGISIYYADGFLIKNCTFKNITRPNMPGAIDIEADSPTNVTRNGKISDCVFDNIGGIACIVMHIKPSDRGNNFSYKNFTVENCKFNNSNSGIAVFGSDFYKEYTSDEKILTIKNSEITNCFIMLDLRKAYGIAVDNLKARNIYTKIHNIVSDGGARNITFKNCTFDTFANPAGLGFTGETYGINFENNTFKNFIGTAITINSPSGVGTIKNNNFLSAKNAGSFPLITAYFKDKNLVRNAKISGNISSQNFSNINLNYFLQSK